ncbi:MAG: Ig-like domain-containing protein, partial [Culicoidibacterales bacterium]
KEDSKVVSYVSITVTKAATSETPKPEETKPTSITLSATTLSMDIGATQKVNASVAPSAATNKNVTFASENNNVVTVDANGTITAKAAGTTRVVVTASGNTSVKAYVSVTVKAKSEPEYIRPTSISVPESNITMDIGMQMKIIATVGPSNATIKNYSIFSENQDVVRAFADGTIRTLATGTAKIRVNASDNTEVITYITITVTEKVVEVPPNERNPEDHALWTLEEMMETLKFRNTYTGEYYNIHNVRWGIHATDIPNSPNGAVGGLKLVENPHQLGISHNLSGEAGEYYDIGTVLTVFSRGVDKTGKTTKDLTVGAHNPAHSFDQLTIAWDKLLKYQ